MPSMGPRLLCFVGGAVLTGFFVSAALLATPFFGSGAFLWAMMFAAFLLATALGRSVGPLLAKVAGARNLDRAAARLAAVGGILAWLEIYFLPEICRLVLQYDDANWRLAPLAAMVLTTFLPGALITAIVSCEIECRISGTEGRPAANAHAALRLSGLMILGGVFGILILAKPLLRADEVAIYVFGYGTGAALALLSLVFLSNLGRALTALGLVALIGLSAAVPSEIQSQQFAVAMQKAWREQQVASLYYLRTKDDDQLTAEELAARTRAAAAHHKHGVIVTCEMLEALGEASVTGEGLCRTLDLMLSPKSKPFLMPMFKAVKSVRADGKGMLFFTIKREKGVEGAKFELPGEAPGEVVKFWFRDDFTIRMDHKGDVWKLEFGPVTVEPAGVLEFNDTKRTPLRILNVVAWVDASLLGIVIEDHPEQIAIKAVAQGDIGDVKTEDVISLAKERRQSK